MTTQPIRLFGDPVLRTPAEPVTVFDAELRRLVADLEETMLAAPGSGLAANQIGVGLRVFTYHVSEDEQGHLINPVLHFPSEEDQDGPEGCLSIPGLTFDCVRKAHVVAHGQNMYGDPITSRAPTGWPAPSSTRPTISTACCSSTDSTARRGARPCARSARRSGPGVPAARPGDQGQPARPRRSAGRSGTPGDPS